jgi:hypothetical protein
MERVDVALARGRVASAPVRARARTALHGLDERLVVDLDVVGVHATDCKRVPARPGVARQRAGAL